METSLKDGEDKELDDSGCVQDVGPTTKQLDEESKEAELLDLSDDVLLLILKYCSPRDLKALGYTCPRLGRLIKDRTLWQRVDAREEPTGRARLRWFLAHALGANTTELMLTGYAREAKGCLGHVDRKRKEIEEEIEMMNKKESKDPEAATTSASGPSQAGPTNNDSPVQVLREDPLTRLQRLYAQQLPRYSGILSWPEDGPGEVDPEDVVLLDGSCPGPQFTLTQCTLRQLRSQCSLTSLTLQYCNINCNTTGINHFPPTLKKLSLRGSKCYNLPLDKSFLFNIQDYLPQLEYLDLSECEWLEPASFLPLSKVSKLTHLIMRDCHRMAEFVAYASLATRYGFRKLQVLDVRGSPLGDSEVAALGWLPMLQELYASPSRCIPPPPPDHSHCRDERLPAHNELHSWEMEEPEYFQIKPQLVEPIDNRSTTSIDDIEEHIEQLRNYENNICLHGVEYNLCMEGIRCAKKSGQSDNTDKQSSKKSTSSKDTENASFPTPTSSSNETNSTPQASTSNETESKNCASMSSRNQTIYSLPSNSSGADVIEISLRSDPSTSNNETQNYVTFKRVRPTQPSNSPNNTRQIFFDPSKNKPQTTESTDQPGPSLKRCQKDESVVPSKKSKSKDENSSLSKNKRDQRQSHSSNEEDSSDDEVPLKRLCKSAVNEGASTSQSAEKPTAKKPCANSEDNSKRKKYDYVRFRQNMEPVMVRRDAEEVEAEEREREERDREMRERQARERQNDNQNVEARPRAHVLYVNVGQQLHTVYRLSIHNEPPIFYSFARNNHLRFRPNAGNIFYTPPTTRLDATSLITDSAIRRFGRADVDDINVVNIGPCRPPGDPGARPNKSNLRVLSVTGFRSITDRSLEHLATAAPHLRRIDFSESGVTARGVENFKSLRADCEVIFSEYVEKEETF